MLPCGVVDLALAEAINFLYWLLPNNTIPNPLLSVLAATGTTLGLFVVIFHASQRVLQLNDTGDFSY